MPHARRNLTDEETHVLDGDDPEVRQPHGRADRGPGDDTRPRIRRLGQERREPVVCAGYVQDAAAADELRETLARGLRRQVLSDEIGLMRTSEGQMT